MAEQAGTQISGTYTTDTYYNAQELIMKVTVVELNAGGWWRVPIVKERGGNGIETPMHVRLQVAILGKTMIIEDQPVRISDQGEIEVVTQEGEKLVVRLYVPMSNASHALADRRIFPYDEGLMIPETRVKFPLPAQK